LILLNYLLSELQAAFISAATSGQLDDDFTDTSTTSDTVLNLSLLLTAIFGWNWVCRYQNVSIRDFIGANCDGGGGDSWSYKTCIKSPPTSNVLQARCPSCCPTNSDKALNGNDTAADYDSVQFNTLIYC